MVASKTRVLILGQGELVNRLPEAMASEAIEFTYAGKPTSPLARSAFVKTFVELRQEAVDVSIFKISEELGEFLEDSHFELVVIADDAIAVGIRTSSLRLETKLRSLPVKNETGLKLIGSKVGFVEIANQLGISIPKSVIVRSSDELAKSGAKFGETYIYKGDFSGGGSQVRLSNGRKGAGQVAIPAAWYPLVLQEFVEGTTVNIDAFFLHGRLKAWTYSNTVSESSTFGPSTTRTYIEPPTKDFLSQLQLLGAEARLHGFLNSTWIYNPLSKQHLWIEADPRPNAWHQFFPRLGIEYAEVLNSGTSDKMFTQTKMQEPGITFSLYPRQLVSGLTTLNMQPTLRWLFRAPGTWEFRNRRDAEVNSHEDISILSFPIQWVVSLLSAFWQASPKGLQRVLVDSGARRLILGLFKL